MHTALLAVLTSEHRARFAIFSHSNGVFYSLYTLLHLPPTLTMTSWTLSAPFVPHKISGNIGLGIAAALPTALPNAFGSLLQIVPPVARAANWSSGLLSAPSSSTQAESIAALEARKSPHEREYMHRSVGSACRVEVMRRSLAESRVAIGQETLFCLHGSSSTGGETVWGLGVGASDAEVLRGAFSRLVERYPGDALSMRVVYGAADGLVPTKGRVWLKATLEELELLRDEQAWTEVSALLQNTAFIQAFDTSAACPQVTCRTDA
ncbi:hypothetical protein FB45DRAFT_906964 [Roridomyces roridus]|uniref:Uncharacterized protein n=1 Tax=Roridomyces roridus TaxID=1738132 RepID=A0AAD7C3A5_9AGAR|nr:hypothetical protein FB45DRAFT_906964 [Roridomyces roridus]